MDISNRIKELRKSHHYTQAHLAELLGVKPTTVASWEQGRNKPLMDKVQRMATIFNVPISEIVEEEVDNKKTKTADLADEDTVFTYEGRQIPPEDLEYMKRLLRGGK